jgi:predicted  nucleic acid-binding Zn-ribbon protein
VKEKILKLIALQQLDNKIHLWQQTAANGPEKLAQARQTLAAIESEVSTLKEKISENSKRRRELEAETTDLNQRRSTNQARQLKARNNDEYRAVLKEAENIATLLTGSEDVLLNLMDEEEKLQAKLPDLEASLEIEEKQYQEKAREIELIIAESQKNEASALLERQTLLSVIPADLMSRYNTVCKNRNGQAMAPVADGLCQVCRLSIPPQLYNELQKTDKLLACPNCARIIYWQHHPYFKDFAPDEPPESDNAKHAPGKGRKTAKAQKPEKPDQEEPETDEPENPENMES